MKKIFWALGLFLLVMLAAQAETTEYKTGTLKATTIKLPISTGQYLQGVSAQTAALEYMNVTEVVSNSGNYFRPVMVKFEHALNPASAPGSLIDYHGLDVISYGSSANLNSNTGIYAIEGRAQYSATATTIFKMVGVYGAPTNVSTGTVSNAVGVQAAIFNSSTGTITDGAGILVNGPTNPSGTITTAYGVKVLSQAGATTSYGVFSDTASAAGKWNFFANGTANNAFLGNTRIGATAAPTVALDVTGAAAVSGGLTVGTSVVPTGSGLKHVRITTGAVSAGLTALVTHTWASAFADANYTCSAEVVDSTAALLALRIVHIETVTASQVAVRINNSSGGDLTGSLHLICMHD